MLIDIDNELCRGVIVADENDDYRCCGIQYKKWVFTSGLILCPYMSPDDLKPNEFLWNVINNTDISDNDLDSFKSDICKLSMKIAKKSFKIISDGGKKYNLHNRKTSSNLSPVDAEKMSPLCSCVGYSVGIFRSSLVSHYVSNNFSDWQLCTEQEQYQDTSADLIQCLLSVFLVLKIGDEEVGLNDDYRTALNYFLKLCSDRQNLYRGLDVIVESTPFTIPQFYNSWSRGIISNNIGNMNCLFYTDVRLVIGCVGAPIYRYDKQNKGNLIGMILNPMLWSQGEWAGFSVAVNLFVVLSEALGYQTIVHNDNKNFTHDLITKKLIDNLDRSIVLVRCGHNWGSGVIINAKLGVILTCAHVVNYGEEETVRIECGKYKTKAKVIYSNKVGEVFDIAILCTEPLLKLKEIPFAKHPPVKGETVFCVGFPLVDTEKVTLSKGIISNIVPGILIQTTCCVQSGASGGAIIGLSGSLFGIAVSNMSSANSRALFPHCNLSVPTAAFASVLTHYFRTKDVTCLEKMASENPLAVQKWSFQNKCRL